MSGSPDRDVSVTRWVVAAVAALGIVLLVALARREPGFDDRVPDSPDESAAVTVEVDLEVDDVG